MNQVDRPAIKEKTMEKTRVDKSRDGNMLPGIGVMRRQSVVGK